MSKLTTISLLRVHYVPKVLESGILYVSEEFGAAVHLCACGCGAKVSTPLGPTEWKLQEAAGGPTLTPSVGSWQLPCQSHYWIRNGQILWCETWSAAQIEAGRRQEEVRRRDYYDGRTKPVGIWQRIWNWISSWFR